MNFDASLFEQEPMFGMMHQSSGQPGAFGQPFGQPVAGPEHQAFCDRCSSSKPGSHPTLSHCPAHYLVGTVE